MARRAGSKLNTAMLMDSTITSNETAVAQRLLMKSLEAAVSECGAQGKHLALILIELGKRGEFGTNGSHANSETLFGELLRAVRAHCGRSDDFVLRLSNERIAAVCPNTHAAGASHVAARIREAAVFLPSRRGIPVPLSIAVVVAGPNSEENAEDLLLRARRTLASARTHPASLLSVQGASSPPRQTSVFACWLKTLFQGNNAPPNRRLGD